MWHLSWAAAAAVLGATAALIAVLTGSAALAAVGGVITVAVVVAGVVVPRRQWAGWRWALTDEGLELAHGVLVRVDSSIPAFRVQQVDLRRGPIERLLGLVSVQVTTASSASDGTLPGLTPEVADSVRRELLSRVVIDDGV
jgi:membrane protein YdbS with pleckstrin-like domain